MTTLFIVLHSITVLAATEYSALLRVYDDGQTSVTSPVVDVSTHLDQERYELGVGYTSDIVSSASSDVESFASKAVTENRQEFSGRLSKVIPAGEFGVSYVNSSESDYNSKGLNIAITRDFYQKNTTLALNTGYATDIITSSADASFSDRKDVKTFSASVAQVLSRNDIIELIADIKVENGYLASPYRRARIAQSDGSVVGIPENHPLTRNRMALSTKWNHFFSEWKLAWSNAYRFYRDNWGVQSHTVKTQLTRDFGQSWSIAVKLRYYLQNAASFYQDIYPDQSEKFYTGNKTLASMTTILFGLKPTYKLSEKITFYGSFDMYNLNYSNFTAVKKVGDPADDQLLSLQATILGLGLYGQF